MRGEKDLTSQKVLRRIPATDPLSPLGDRPQFFFRKTSVTGELTLPEGVEMVMPSDHTPLDVSLDKPIALEAGSRFAIREGGKTVGSGVVTEVID